MIVIDGSYGEGGGQVLRTSLALSAILGVPVRIENVRLKRPNPGLAAQHLTGVKAITKVCGAGVEGASLGSTTLTFAPHSAPKAGEYGFDVAQARRGGSAGAVSLVFQTIFLPLALSQGDSRLFLRGGTHVAWSPPFHYLKFVYLPTLMRTGIEANLDLERWGWYPIGGGTMTGVIKGMKSATLEGLDLSERGKLKRLWGLSASSNLPAHIARRQRRQAEILLRQKGFQPQMEIVEAPSPGQGTFVFLLAEWERGLAGFTAYGRRGKPAETVAEEAATGFLEYQASGASLEQHLADQLILPMALAGSPSTFTTSKITQHLLTNIWVAEQFMGTRFTVEGQEGQSGRVKVQGYGVI